MYFEFLRVARETRSSTPHHFERRCFVCGLSQELVLAGQLAKTLSCAKNQRFLFQSKQKSRFCVLFRDIFPSSSSLRSSIVWISGHVQRICCWNGALLGEGGWEDEDREAGGLTHEAGAFTWRFCVVFVHVNVPMCESKIYAAAKFFLFSTDHGCF